MTNTSKWTITEEQKKRFINALLEELSSLRAKVGISQAELAKLIGISRQTYSAVESRSKEMSWGIYLSLILFFDYNQKTHQFIRNISAFPTELVLQFNEGAFSQIRYARNVNNEYNKNIQEMIDTLDEQGIKALRTVLMVEYSRCTQMDAESIIKSFGGSNATQVADEDAVAVRKALKRMEKESEF